VPPPPVEDDERDPDEVAYEERIWGGIGSFVWAPDSASLYYTCRNKLFNVPVAGGEPKCLISGDTGIGGLQFSLDGQKLGLTLNGNFWIFDIAQHTFTQVTYFGGKADVSAGGFNWSPDGRWVYFAVTDSSMYGTVKMPDYAPLEGVKMQELRRSNAGEPQAKVRLFLVPATGGRTPR
jgi:Tol biopolymer transport system component